MGEGSNKKIMKNFTQNFSDGLQVGLFRGIVRLRHITLQAVVKNSHKGAKHQKPLTADLRRLAQKKNESPQRRAINRRLSQISADKDPEISPQRRRVR